jgi:hypothetical protein
MMAAATGLSFGNNNSYDDSNDNQNDKADDEPHLHVLPPHLVFQFRGCNQLT